MGSFAKHQIILTANATLPTSSKTPPPLAAPTRRAVLTSAGILLAMTSAFSGKNAYAANEMTTGDLAWGTRSWFREKYFQPGLTSEEAAARIKHTAEAMRTLREMLERMAWRYALFYVRSKSAYLELDLKNAMKIVPEEKRKEYVRAANQLVDDMTELDRFIRSPKVYESYLYYERTLKSLDNVVTFLV